MDKKMEKELPQVSKAISMMANIKTVENTAREKRPWQMEISTKDNMLMIRKMVKALMNLQKVLNT